MKTLEKMVERCKAYKRNPVPQNFPYFFFDYHILCTNDPTFVTAISQMCHGFIHAVQGLIDDYEKESERYREGYKKGLELVYQSVRDVTNE